MGIRKPLGQFLTVDGEAPESESDYRVTGNYSTETEFYISPPDGKVYELSELQIRIADGGGVQQGSYGNNIALSSGEGILLQLVIDGVTYDLTNGQRITTNFQWDGIGKGERESSGDDSYRVVYSFKDKFTFIPKLSGSDKLLINAKGDFSGLNPSGSNHTFYATGAQLDT